MLHFSPTVLKWLQVLISFSCGGGKEWRIQKNIPWLQWKIFYQNTWTSLAAGILNTQGLYNWFVQTTISIKFCLITQATNLHLDGQMIFPIEVLRIISSNTSLLNFLTAMKFYCIAHYFIIILTFYSDTIGTLNL